MKNGGRTLRSAAGLPSYEAITRRLPVRVSLSGVSRVHLGIVCGIVFGILDVLLMIPLSFPDKRVAMAGAFFDRFAIGFLVCVVDLPLPGWATGLIVALLVSVPSAIITKAYAPILGLGAVGGVLIGIVRAKYGR
jgi:hypothetical protein